ncbi:MAG: DUF1232 domain-containing protein [Desulfuromonas sp.]|nr:DUF1232 domain-containing protein [Desulfuromonas sp.]
MADKQPRRNQRSSSPRNFSSTPLNWLHHLKTHGLLLVELMRHPATPRHVKWLLVGSVLYLLSPIDLIPDMIPILGITDDAALIGLVVNYANRFISDEMRESVRRRQS